jgi:hypothetical protein
MGAANFKGVSISTVMDDKSFRRLCVTLGCLTGPQWRVTGMGAFGCAPGTTRHMGLLTDLCAIFRHSSFLTGLEGFK